MNSIFRFRQDLRIIDNTTLLQAIKSWSQIMPIFIFDSNILDKRPSNDARISFLIDTANQLDSELQKIGSRLYIYYWDPSQTIPLISQKYQIANIYYNKSYGIGSMTRDKNISERCAENNIWFLWSDDFLLHKLGDLPQMQIYTPRWRRRQKLIYDQYISTNYKVTKPDNIKTLMIEHDNESTIQQVIDKYKPAPNLHWPVWDYKNNLTWFDFGSYDENRNEPSANGTTKLSPYIRFGLVSIRWIYIYLMGKYGNQNEQVNHFISELGWREFWYQILYYQPESAIIEFQEKRRNLQWQNKSFYIDAFLDGTTGYPIVDAGIRQLKSENRVHGRVRMILASFLTKDLLVDWRIGEKLFADYLLDYDRAVNIGNRQWSASVWADPKPIRIFNPILQSQKFDPECKYILKYIPELAWQPLAAIHDPIKYNLKYHKPIVNHYEQTSLAKNMYYGDRN
jgi:deoxyribodipyrimidine photo-lyase